MLYKISEEQAKRIIYAHDRRNTLRHIKLVNPICVATGVWVTFSDGSYRLDVEEKCHCLAVTLLLKLIEPEFDYQI